MKAIILAAGIGSRLKKYTKEIPKGLLTFLGKSLISRQIETLRECDVNNIVIVTGFCSNKFDIQGVKYIHNTEYSTTNMLYSLFLAKDEFDDEILLSYGDILYEERILQTLIHNQCDIGVVVDTDWSNYWNIRYKRCNYDLESLSIEKKGNCIVELGRQVDSINEISARYIGLMKFSATAITKLVTFYEELKVKIGTGKWSQSGKSFEQGYMTDFLNAIIVQKEFSVKAVKIKRGWLEFDTNEDYEIYNKLSEQGTLSRLIKLT